MQDRMLSMIEDPGYTTNLAARSRARNLVWSIRLVVNCPFTAEVTQGRNRATAQSKLYPLIYTTDNVRKTDPRVERRDERRAVAAACKTCIKPRSAQSGFDSLVVVR